MQTSAIVKSFDQLSREEITKHFDAHVSIPQEHTAAMKANLSVPWNLRRNVRAWISTFKIKLASEGKIRQLTNEWIGEGLRSEHAPLFVKGKIEPRAWCYLFNVVGHILKILDDLNEAKLLVNHVFIPNNEIVVKIGGNHGGTSHGGKSFKMSYQIANVNNPNVGFKHCAI